jgi:hypothetical protein
LYKHIKWFNQKEIANPDLVNIELRICIEREIPDKAKKLTSEPYERRRTVNWAQFKSFNIGRGLRWKCWLNGNIGDHW